MPRLTTKQKEQNFQRADRGSRALAAYAAILQGERDDEGDIAITLIDLLTDLRHMAAYDKVDFDRALATSQIHFHCEQNGEG